MEKLRQSIEGRKKSCYFVAAASVHMCVRVLVGWSYNQGVTVLLLSPDSFVLETKQEFCLLAKLFFLFFLLYKLFLVVSHTGRHRPTNAVAVLSSRLAVKRVSTSHASLSGLKCCHHIKADQGVRGWEGGIGSGWW